MTSFWAKTQNLIWVKYVKILGTLITLVTLITEPILVTRQRLLSGITNFRRIFMSCLLKNINFVCHQKLMNSEFFKNFHHSAKPLTSIKMVIKSTYLLNLRSSMFSVFLSSVVCQKKGCFGHQIDIRSWLCSFLLLSGPKILSRFLSALFRPSRPPRRKLWSILLIIT